MSLDLDAKTKLTDSDLSAKIEPFDSFWEGPRNVEKGYHTFYQFYRNNYLRLLPGEKTARILVISCGPGYFMNMLARHGYANILGIDSDAEKVRWAVGKNLNCKVDRAFAFLDRHKETFDVIFCEQELNHLAKNEIVAFLDMCRESLKSKGILIVHSLNGANPITGAEALAQNFDHYNTFTEYTMRQVLDHCGFGDIEVLPLNLYVFYKNPLNYILILLAGLYTLFFRFSFILYGKENRLWTKKIAAACRKTER
jgi:2-polyprenyl-3-methyl-5-hydroxy-6-metoxy-1,4-benzoquinol methylase